jgi:3-oxoacyl-[acyl-carrier protein] reductase
MNTTYSDRIIVVTGASTGLGRAIAVETARRGARAVIVNYASNEAEARITTAMVQSYGAEAICVQGDVGSDDDCQAIVAAASPFGNIDVLFNNAGVTKFASHGDLAAITAEDFQRLYRINVVGAFQMIRAAQRLLEGGKDPGAVVNTSSLAGVIGIGSSVPYAASKGALITMTLSLARALAPRIRVNAICPGYIDTPWFGENPDRQIAMRNNAAKAAPLGVASTADDIAASAVFLGSTDARHITGETLLIDAGVHLNLGR